MSTSTDAFVESHREQFLEELNTFLRIPSISTLEENRPDIERAAEFVAESLRKAGLENVEIIKTDKHPLVYADWMHAPGKPTVLCYGHYDVQPPDPLEEWVSPPFEPTIRDGNLYARGSSDDKGQLYIHVKAMEVLRAVNGTLPVNVKFIDRGRGRGRRRIHRQLRGRESRKAESRRGAGFRHRAFRRRHPDPVHRAARPRLYWKSKPRARRATCIPACTAGLRRTRSSA